MGYGQNVFSKSRSFVVRRVGGGILAKRDETREFKEINGEGSQFPEYRVVK